MQTLLECGERNCLVRIAGRITVDSSPDFRKLLLQHLESPACEVLTLDLNDVVYVDTSCIAVLLEVLREARAQRKKFRLTGLHDRARNLLETTRILQLFDGVLSEPAPLNSARPK